MKELKAYCRVNVAAGEEKEAVLHLNNEDFWYYNVSMEFGLHDGDHRLMLGASSEDIRCTFELYARNGRLTEKQ
jgi:beta-glucosidase